MSFQETGMQWRKRLAMVGSVSTLALILSACGEGTSKQGANYGSGASGEKKVTEFKVDNTTRYDIKSMTLVNLAGSVVREVQFSCASKASTCEFEAAISAPGRLLFKDKKGNVIGVASVSPSDKEPRAFIQTSQALLGGYIYAELIRLYPQAEGLLQPKLSRFFKDYQTDKLYDNNQRLAAYYFYRVIDQGVTVNEFYKNLNESLGRGEILESGLKLSSIQQVISKTLAGLSNIQVISSAYAQDAGPTCPNGTGTALTIAGAIAETVPGVSVFTEIAKNVCEEADSANIENALNKISADVKKLNDAVQKVEGKVDALAGIMNGEIASKYIQDLMNARRIYLNDYMDKYFVLTKGHGSLAAYVKSRGGLKKAFNIDQTGNTNLDYVLHMSNAWKGLDYVNADTSGKWGDFGSFVDALHRSCNTPTSDSPTTDIVKNRVECNAKIDYYKTYVAANNAQFLLVFKDVTDTLQSYMDKEGDVVRAHADGPTANQPTSWTQMYTDTIRPTLREAIASAAAGKQFAPAGEDYVGGFYKLEAGLPSVLVNNLNSDEMHCNRGWATMPVPNLVSWVKNGENSYITVRCWSNDTGSTVRKLYKSRYYYEKDGNDVMNILGVVATADRSKDRSAEEYKFEADGSGGNGVVGTADIFIPQNFGVYAGDNFPSQAATKVDPQLVSGSRITHSPEAKAGFSVYRTSAAHYAKTGGNQSLMYVRYTESNAARKDSEPLSYLWKVAFWQNGNALTANGLSAAMICVTWNCGRAADELTFYDRNGADGYDGPKDVWHGSRPLGFYKFFYRIGGVVYDK